MGTDAMGETVKSYECPKCRSRMARVPSMFHWRGRFFHGQVCTKCNSLWDDPEDSFSDFARCGKGPVLKVYEEAPTTWERLEDAD
jgi:ssDNA-binding Zn-finger/Zn-ribbon topoisomerase 1